MSWSASGEVFVGDKARRRATLDPRNTFSSFKRLMGSEKDDKSSSSPTLWCPNLDRIVTPAEASAELLKELLRTAQTFSGLDIDRAVITVPTRFSHAAVDATRQAAQLAGLERTVILQEPVAAALAHAFVDVTRVEEQLLLVFDLGGGTCDVSVLEAFDGIIEVVATNGDPKLGGDDMDAALGRWLLNSQQSLGGEKLLDEDPLQRVRLREAAEMAKIQLSHASRTRVRVPFMKGTAGIDTEVTVATFQAEIAEL